MHCSFAHTAMRETIVLVFPCLGPIQQDDIHRVLASDFSKLVGYCRSRGLSVTAQAEEFSVQSIGTAGDQRNAEVVVAP